MTDDVDGAGPAEALVSCLRLDDIAPLLIAWQQTREAIGSVETSQPYQMSAAMAKLIAAREEMERSVNALLQSLHSPEWSAAERSGTGVEVKAIVRRKRV